MTDQPADSRTIKEPDAITPALLDALDALARARDLNRMLALSACHTADDRARSTLAEAIEQHMAEAFALLARVRTAAA